MSVRQVALTTEEQIEAERLEMLRFNQCAEQAGWGVRDWRPLEARQTAASKSLKRAPAFMQKLRPSLNSAAASSLLACSNFFG